jgi:hypothetical protein
MIVTIIYKLLEEFIQDHGKLPRKLHLNLGIERNNSHKGLGELLDIADTWTHVVRTLILASRVLKHKAG